mmetsp:Transcript_259/g.265  ORF Transcript_259/g.265 Transcript_259/m.265 type:complete len:169 (-) Transcript_259:426-932(-)
MAYCGLGPILRKVRLEKEADSDDDQEGASEAVLAEAFRRTPRPKTASSSQTGQPQMSKQFAAEASKQNMPAAAFGKVRMSKAERRQAKKSPSTREPISSLQAQVKPVKVVNATPGSDAEKLTAKRRKSQPTHEEAGSADVAPTKGSKTLKRVKKRKKLNHTAEHAGPL